MRGLRSSLVLLGFVGPLLASVVAPAHAIWPYAPTVNVPLCTAASHQEAPTIVADGSGGAIVAWQDLRGGNYDIYVQRVSGAGVAQWAADGVALCIATGNQEAPTIVADGSGGAIVAWRDYRSGTNYDIYAQRVSAAGVAQWVADGVALCTATSNEFVPTMVADGFGGAIVTWTDGRSGNWDIYAQRVSAAGVAQWVANGVAVCSATNTQDYPMIAADGSGGAIVTWQDLRGGNYDIYVQRLSGGGAAQWATNGIALCSMPGYQDSPTIVVDGSGGAIVTWRDLRSGTNWDIYAQRVNAAGVAQWTGEGVALSTSTGDQTNPTIASDGSGGAIVTWQDYGFGDWNIGAQRVTAAGAPQWSVSPSPTGRVLCSATGEQSLPRIVADGSGGAIVTWRDARLVGNWDIYAQRVSGAGVVQWTADGVALCTATGSQDYPAIASNGGAGAIVTWQDSRSGNRDVYAQRIERYGYLGSPEPEIVSVLDLSGDQGGRVRIKWKASCLDTVPTLEIGVYGVWRRVAEGAATAAIARGALLAGGDCAGGVAPGVFRVARSASGTTWWEGVGTVAARGEAWYTFVAETLRDSSAAGNPYTTFMVDAHAAFVPRFWDSSPDSGYSVDDLSPGIPAAFGGQYESGTARLHWLPNGEADLAGYRLYRGTTADFVPGPGNLVAEQADTGYVDAAGAPYCYKLCAVDVHGNLSAYALAQPSGTTGVGATAARLSLSLASASPTREGALLRWALPVEGAVRLVVYDVAGRQVRELVRGPQGAGERETRWDGRDGGGAAVGAGLYLARLEACGRVLSVRMTMLR